MQTIIESQYDLSRLLQTVRLEGELRIKGSDGMTFVIKPEERDRSPLDCQGIDLGLTNDEIVSFVRESRDRL